MAHLDRRSLLAALGALSLPPAPARAAAGKRARKTRR